MQSKIDNLIAKKLSGNASPQEAHDLEVWIAGNQLNSAYYAEAERIWHLSGSLRAPASADDVDAAWNEFAALASSHKKVVNPVPRYRQLLGTQAFRAAAVIFFIISTVFFIRLLVFTGDDHPSALASNVAERADTFSAPQLLIPQLADSAVSQTPSVAAEKKLSRRHRKPQVAMIAVSSEDSAMVFTLPDNSRVFLNKNSKLVYPEKFNATDRSVYLSGEAYFELAVGVADFFIYCHDTRTRVMGTSLNVKGLRDGQVEISAIEGNLEVSRRYDLKYPAVLVKAGEQLTYNNGTHASVKSKITRKDKWWKRGSFRMKVREFFTRIIHPRGKESAESR